jgi:uncharacterized protein (DUF1810 family)
MEVSGDLERFVLAQDTDSAYDRALDELRAGTKVSHWIWFVLPQVRGLGTSAMAMTYGLAGRDEAAAYLAHPVLGPRMRAVTSVIATSRTADAVTLMGSSIDAKKLQSSMTLFSIVAPQDPLFDSVLATYFGGLRDQLTLDLLNR